MDELIEQITPEYMGGAMMDLESFIECHKDGSCELVDLRMDFERDVWDLKFGLKIPLNELGKRSNELPNNKKIVLACPTGPRSIVAWTYLKSKGYDVVFLKGGLEILTATLKGGQAKQFLS